MTDGNKKKGNALVSYRFPDDTDILTDIDNEGIVQYKISKTMHNLISDGFISHFMIADDDIISENQINKIWIFKIQDGVCGGIIIADSEDEARKKLSLDRGTDMTKDICEIYSLNALDLNKDVHNLW